MFLVKFLIDHKKNVTTVKFVCEVIFSNIHDVKIFEYMKTCFFSGEGNANGFGQPSVCIR